MLWCKSVLFETKTRKPVVKNIFFIKLYYASCYIIRYAKKYFISIDLSLKSLNSSEICNF